MVARLSRTVSKDGTTFAFNAKRTNAQDGSFDTPHPGCPSWQETALVKKLTSCRIVVASNW